MAVSGFAHAPVTKGILITTAIASVSYSLFQLKPYAHFQLHPHISIHHQWYRLILQHLGFVNSSELFLALYLFYYAGRIVERTFGSHKFASFLFVTTAVYTLLQVVLLAIFSRVLSNTGWVAQGKSPAGPWAPLYAVLYQHARIVPDLWYVLVGSACVGERTIKLYFLGFLLSLSQPTRTPIFCGLAILVSSLYRSEWLMSSRLKAYRIPNKLYRILSSLLRPWIGTTRLPTRSWRVEPPQRRSLASRQARLAEHREAVRNANRNVAAVPQLANLLRRRAGFPGSASADGNAPPRQPPILPLFATQSQGTALRGPATQAGVQQSHNPADLQALLTGFAGNLRPPTQHAPVGSNGPS